MSRIGKRPVEVPQGIKAHIAGQLVKIEGPKGKLERTVRPEIKVELVGGKIVLTPQSDLPETNAFHGMERALVNSMVVGVSQGYTKELELIGVGYRAEMKGNTLNLGLGFSHPVDVALPKEVKGSVVKEGRETWIRLEGVDKQLVAQTAAKIIALRSPEIYKGKGVRYRGQKIKLKPGKAGKK